MDTDPSHRKEDFNSPTLSLSLAGVFRNAVQQEQEVEEGEEESGVVRGGDAVEISSENTRGGGQLEDEVEPDGLAEEDGEIGKRKKKRKSYHRHKAEQIRVMEEFFKEFPHPDVKQRQELSKQLGLSPRQVKFWFQNRRTQIKVMQERHEQYLLKSEMEKLKEENSSMREEIKQASCPNCGFAILSKGSETIEEQQLRIENAMLKAEIEKLRGKSDKQCNGTASPSSACTVSNDQVDTSSLGCYSGVFGLPKARILDIVERAMEELIVMSTSKEPLWVQRVEPLREILNYDAYVRRFSPQILRTGHAIQSIEASRETGVVLLDVSGLVQVFMDVNQWKQTFSCMISKATTIYEIFRGEDGSKNGAVQLMYAEHQILTPMVPTRELYFVRYCKQLGRCTWAILDVSIDKIEDNIDASLLQCWKHPSGCIIEDKANGQCEVTWVEHMECQRNVIPVIYRSMMNSGVAFGARRWMATLQLQCEWLVFSMAINVPLKDSNGVPTTAGRKSILKLAQRMTSNFCHAIGAPRGRAWSKLCGSGGEDVRFTTRRNINEHGEPVGLILTAVTSTWLPVSSSALFSLLRDDSRRTEWDALLFGGPTETIVNIAKGQDRGNSVTLHAAKGSKEGTSPWVLQDSCTNSCESMVVHAPVDVAAMRSVMAGCDSNGMNVLPCGFSIIPDNLGTLTKPLVISSTPPAKAIDDGSLLTLAFQLVADASPAAKLTMESVELANSLISCTLCNIKRVLHCEDD